MRTTPSLPIAVLVGILAGTLPPTPSPAPEELPRIVRVGAVAPDILGITVEAGRAVPGTQDAYTRKDGDSVDRPEELGNGFVRRDGKLIGALVGPRADILRRFDSLEGPSLDAARADRPESYAVSSPDDPAYASGLAPLAVHRKSKPSDMAWTGPWEFRWPMVHVLYLRLPSPLAPGKTYAVAPAGDLLPACVHRHQPDAAVTEAVHVSQVGFRPDDPAKVAFLSCWLGTGGALSYPEGTGFRVLDDRTGTAVLSGRAVLSKAAAAKDEDPYKKNYSGTDVHILDFSGLRAPGIYRVAVDGIGCSTPFEIGPDVWRRAFIASARGLYHQRSGIALRPPFTDWERPRPFHPDDGLKVFASTCSLLDSGNGLNAMGTDRDNFGNLVKGRTEEVVPDAWGGYFDAGDWDRRIQHLDASRLLLEILEVFPEFSGKVNLGIPESANDLPDLLDEALWNIDFFERLRTKDGGVRGGIESAEHPRRGEASWQESLPVTAYAPDPWCSFLWAADAARAAALLRPHQADRAAALLDGSRRAAGWAEAELARMGDRKLPHPVQDARNLAAASLLAATGEARWNDLFLATTAFRDPKSDACVWQSHDQRDAAFVYARIGMGADEGVRANARRAIIREADVSVAFGAGTGFQWTKRNPWEPFNGGKASVPQVIPILRAHALTGDGKYLRAAVLAAQSGAGANPANLCYTTGVGSRWPLHPLVVDAHVMGRPPPPGITVYGPSDPERIGDQFSAKLLEPVMTPPLARWPAMEAYVDIFLFPVVTEFTVMETIGPNAYAWGYLAARPAASLPPRTAGIEPPSPAPALAWPGETIDAWHGFRRHSFTIEGCPAWVVEPTRPLPGNPWSWCLEFPDAFTDGCAAPTLLAKGFHHAYIAVGNTFGCPAALRRFDTFHASLVARGLAEKAVLIGLSRGGLYAYRWAAENPGRVAVIYGDAPVCDFKSWPGGKGAGKGSPGDWAELLRCYGFRDEAEALAFRGNPVDSLEPLARARVPIIHVVGDVDDVVPPAENTAVIEARYRELGGEIRVIHKFGVGHHPHGLDDPSPVVDFILERTVETSRLVLRGGSVFDPIAGGFLADQEVVIEGDRIRVVSGPGGTAPQGARVVDCRGKFLLPGLIDAHVHLVHLADRSHVTGDEFLPMFLASGVTSVRDAGDEIVAQSIIARSAELRQELCPRVFLTSPLIDADPPLHRDVGYALTDPAKVRAFVQEMARWRVTTLKIYVGTTRHVGRAVIDEGHRAGMKVIAHLGNYSAQDAVLDGVDSLEHIWSVFNYIVPPEEAAKPDHRAHLDLHNPSARELIAALAERQVFVDPTLVVFRNMIYLTDLEGVHDHPDVARAPLRMREYWSSYRQKSGLAPETRDARRKEFRKYQELTGLLHRAGVPLLAGTDTPEPFVPPGFSLHQELELLVESGLSPAAALAAATIQNARALDQQDRLGTVSPGKLADLVILDADPTIDIRNTRRIHAVVRGGSLCDPATILRAVPVE